MRISLSLLALCMAIVSPLACGPEQPTVEPAASTGVSEPVTPQPVTPEPATPEPETPELVTPPSEPEQPPSEPEQPPSEPEQPPSEPELEPEKSDSCQVMLIVEAKGRLTAPVVTLRASAKNLTDAPLELTLTDACPGGEALFSGLEATDDDYYDYYNTCTAGTCGGGRPPMVIALPPGETVEISSTEIKPAGDKPCNEPIAAGTYELSFTVKPRRGVSNPVLCGPEPLKLRRK